MVHKGSHIRITVGFSEETLKPRRTYNPEKSIIPSKIIHHNSKRKKKKTSHNKNRLKELMTAKPSL